MRSIRTGMKKRVILVEDDEAYRRVLAQGLHANGMIEVIDVRLAMDALDHLDRDPTIRKAVVNLRMPANTLTGLAFARMMRHRNSEALVILISDQLNYLAIEEAEPFGGILFKKPDAAALAADIHNRLVHGAA
jgi:DNA-binding NtrC family response regulator